MVLLLSCLILGALCSRRHGYRVRNLVITVAILLIADVDIRKFLLRQDALLRNILCVGALR